MDGSGDGAPDAPGKGGSSGGSAGEGGTARPGNRGPGARRAGAGLGARLVDARILVWLLAIVFLTGLPLMLLFDAEPAVHARRLQSLAWLRHIHAAASLAFLVGAVWHLAVRLGGTLKGVRTGAWLLISAGLATVSGALAAQTDDARRIARQLGATDATIVAAVGHIAYGSVLVLLTLYLHVARWGWRQVFGDARHAMLALLPALALAWLLPVGLPGGAGGGATAWIAPPWPVLAAWPVLLGLGVWGASAMRRGP